MRKIIKIMAFSAIMAGATSDAAAQNDNFEYNNERFADLQMLRYQVKGFDQLSLKQKTFIYYLTEAAMYGRDILYDQNGRYNLRIRRILEDIYISYDNPLGYCLNQNPDVAIKERNDYDAFVTYLKRVWFSNGIHHHYGSEKFVPGFSKDWFMREAGRVMLEDDALKPYRQQLGEIADVMFNPDIMQKRVNLADGEDLVLTSAGNYYQGVTQAEAEAFYEQQRDANDPHPVMYGMNSRLVKKDGKVQELVWTTGGLYGQALTRIVDCLKKARPFAEDKDQQAVIDKLVEFYTTGDLRTFDDYTILWAANTAPQVDFVNGFTESYGDPLGMKASWESIVNFKDLGATKRTETLSANAQWFEDHSPVDSRFKKEKVKGISAKVITAAILGGDLYPSTAIGINLPNSDWVRKEHGSKSVTIGNLTEAYNLAAKGNGFRDEFIDDPEVIKLVDKYADVTDDLHTDLHECLGHGSGKLLDGVSPDSLKAYGSTLEEGRADLFGLYYVADPKMVELGLTPDMEAYKAQYYTYMMNGLMTQLVRIQLGNDIEEAHMRNRAFVARWCYEKGKAEKVVELVKKNGKTYVRINDYEKLRGLFGQLLAEVQRIKSTGDYAAAQALIEGYGVKIDPELHKEVLERYEKLNLAPYKGFINPVYTAVKDAAGNITDVKVTYSEGYADQMLRYSKQYATLPLVNE